MNGRLVVPQSLETPRLVLRRHRPEDVEAFAVFLRDPDATRYLAFTPEEKTREGAQHLLGSVIASYATDAAILSLTIADARSDAYLGSCGASPDGDDVEIYYTVAPAHQGAGIATEAARALVGYVASRTPARMVAHVMPGNVASVRVAERLGFVDAGPVRRPVAGDGGGGEPIEGRRYVLPR